ncbi:Hypothetical predicted protein [Pelobates cultripes]|uniref:Uncharacterized protein n=1 Tax=Pelobates cultripes TaxID=61616 RepID=A0AAD1SNR3_PELCU|nr:Hypothetical predicted protein [Pelobates cultripes]
MAMKKTLEGKQLRKESKPENKTEKRLSFFLPQQPGNKTNRRESLQTNNTTEGDINKGQDTGEGRKEYNHLLKHLDSQFERLREEMQTNTRDIKKELAGFYKQIQGTEEKLDALEHREIIYREEYLAMENKLIDAEDRSRRSESEEYQNK